MPFGMPENSRDTLVTIRDNELHRSPQGAMEPIRGHELHGARQVGQWPADELVDLWGRASSGIVKHAIAIEYRDLEPPKTGIFDGLRIVIDPDVAFEMQCFLLLHLFGHSVQWVAPSLAHKLADLQHTEDRDHFM